ncbi:MAG: ABC transporter ATP-binding protein [Endozoicomonas sp.]
MILLDRVHFQFPGFEVLQNLSFTVEANQTTAILGPSGCGKTTLLKLLSGLLQPTSGRIKRSKSHLDTGCIFQDFRLLPWFTVFDNVALGLKAKNELSGNDVKNRVDSVLSMVKLEAFAARYPYQLSGGMQQRVGIARALVGEPSMILMDEPFSSLDGQTRCLLVEEFRTWCQVLPMTRVLVTHQLEDVIDLADRAVLLSSGPARVLQSIDVRKYLARFGAQAFREAIWGVMKAEVLKADQRSVI